MACEIDEDDDFDEVADIKDDEAEDDEEDDFDDSFDDDVLNILSEYIISNIDNHREFLKDHSLKAIKDWYKKN